MDHLQAGHTVSTNFLSGDVHETWQRKLDKVEAACPPAARRTSTRMIARKGPVSILQWLEKSSATLTRFARLAFAVGERHHATLKDVA